MKEKPQDPKPDPRNPIPDKERLDILVQRQANVTRSKAQGLIQTGNVFTQDGQRLEKPGMRLPIDSPLEIRGEQKYVSRGGHKLEAAIDAFALAIDGKIAIDVGASTGGFTDCLLQRGATRVYAVDVGYGQLAWKLRQDPRVVVIERTNIRELDQLPERPDFFTVDCSFISLRLVLAPLKKLLAKNAEGVILIKPQFEAGKDKVGKGGVIRDEAVHADVVRQVTQDAVDLGFHVRAIIESPLLGPAGNKEFLAYLTLQR
jgi:23S rRNA (cytidine1920-2'-O)/16S rRNA (cytidine1409-2'-O)-methyltransferase